MAGLYDIDIENCHYAILAQMAASHGYQCTEVLAYLANKKQVRESLAAEFGISVRQAKDALIALIYGAKFSVRATDALPKIFNDTKRIEAAILEATGYRLEVEQKAIQVNLSEAFDAHPDDTNNQIEKAQFLQWKPPVFTPFLAS